MPTRSDTHRFSQLISTMLKKLLFSVLPLKLYLKIIGKGYFFSYYAGMLKGNYVYDGHYLLNDIVHEGETVLDIGANLGYYSVPLSNLVGKQGKVYAVEPVQTFREVLMDNIASMTKNPQNVEIVPYALGDEHGKKIKISTPIIDGVLKHGRSEVSSTPKEATGNVKYIHSDAEIRSPKQLFGQLAACDFIKIDTEGFEIYIVPELEDLIAKFKPLLYIEANYENCIVISNILRKYDYSLFITKGGRLIEVKTEEGIKTAGHEHYYLTPALVEKFRGLID